MNHRKVHVSTKILLHVSQNKSHCLNNYRIINNKSKKKNICECVNGLSYLFDNIAVTLREHAFKKKYAFSHYIRYLIFLSLFLKRFLIITLYDDI